LLHGCRGAGIGAFAAVLRGHFRRGLHAQGYFLVGAHIDVLGFAGHFIFGSVEEIPEKRHRCHDKANDKAEIETHS
jgi:hypothetical protein